MKDTKTMRLLRGKVPAAAVLAGVILMFIGIMGLTRSFRAKISTYEVPSTIITGEYSVDGGPWIKTVANVPINDHFRKIVFRGKIDLFDEKLDEADISLKNVWAELRSADGELCFSNDYRIKGTEAWKERYGSAGEGACQDSILMPFAVNMPFTPGYEHFTLNRESIAADREYVFTVENPYNSYYSFSDCVSFTLSSGNGSYLRSSKETMLPSAVLLLVCFFGIFFFPVISFVFGKVNYRYLTFGFLCFFWGQYMLMRYQSFYINNFISDPVVCMIAARVTAYFFFASLLVYVRSNLKKALSRILSGMAVLVYFGVAAAGTVLQFTGVCDLARFAPTVHIVMGADMVLLAVLLAHEAKTDSSVMKYTVSWIPMVTTILIDIMDQFISLPGDHYFKFGFVLTLIVQLIQLVSDLKQQYKESIRYQQMQKELYEARVAVMTSQIQPHFIYNALTSIAMMRTIDPKTAQEATITFAKYLRGNMDSIRQTAPVDFATELEHLKKYLYIEKLRFADKLKIEYDIQTTDFVIPLLTVQPLVENAVKHGVGMKKKGGTVRIATRETDTAYEIIISDDGVGFDTSAPRMADGRSHIGMENTRTRLKEMCGGEIFIESTVGEGTTATITLPRTEQGKEDAMQPEKTRGMAPVPVAV